MKRLIWIKLCVLQIVTCAATALGEVQRFPLDEPPANNDVVGKVDFDQKGKDGNCATFYGYGSIYLTKVTFDTNSKFSISFRVKGKSQMRKVIVGSEGNYWSSNSAGGGFSIFSNGISAMAMHTAGKGNSTNNQFSAEGPVLDGVWRHFVYVKDGRDITIYIDGKQTSTKILQPDIYKPGNEIALYAGGVGEARGSCFSGSIDDLHIFDRPLANAEVNALAEGVAPDELGKNVVSQREMDYQRTNQNTPPAAGGINLDVAAKELSKRDGVPNFFAKASAGKPVTIAYFGGSITAHPGWRPQSFKAIQEMFPSSKMTMINASIGGTGSVVGAFRADRDLVRHNPDLVFIEFAVNDGSSAARNPQEKWRALEGIIRKLKKNKPDTDICFFYTMQESHLKDLRNGLCYRAVAVHEKVADWYRLPSIYVGPAVTEAVDRGEAVFKAPVADRTTGRDASGRLVITEDATHPVVPTGHKFYANVAKRSIEAMKNSPGIPGENQLRNAMMTDNYEAAKTIPIHGNAEFSGSWDKLTAENGPGCMRFGKGFYERFPFLYQTETPGSSVSISFRGTHIGIKGVQGKDGGVITTTLDGRVLKEEPQFSVYHRDWFFVGRPEGPFEDGDHTMTWALTDNPIDKLAILKSYYRKGNEQDLLDNPAEYATHRFSAGEILLIGEIIRPRAGTDQ